MRLELGSIAIDALEFGARTALADHTLVVERDEIRQLVDVQREGWATTEWQLEDPVAVADQVVVSVRFLAWGRTSGIETRARSANVYTLSAA